MRPMLIQILRWLKQPNVWSFVCFASYAIGLLCYALSASSTHLLGKWSRWKILLYVVVSSITCLLYLFARRWQDSVSSWLGAILVFLVLTITSMYSFFSDQKMKEKPDAYILLSWAAFAIAPLCFSRQIHYGFEVDLLNFFCGGLIILLMKINLWLLTVGAAFTGLLVILHAYLDALQRSQRLRGSSLDHVVIRVHSDSQETNNNTHSAFEENSFTQPGNSDSGVKNIIEELRKENQKLTGTVSKHVDEYLDSNNKIHVDVNLVVDALSSELIDDLNKKVKLMVEAGFEEQCCHVYSSWRSEFLGEYLSTTFGLQVEELNVENIREKCESWEKALTVAVRVLFPNERRLLDRVFHGLSSAADTSFMEVCTQSLMSLLSFVDTLLVMRNHSGRSIYGIDHILRNPLRFLLDDFGSMFEAQDSVLLSKVFVLWRIMIFKIDINERIYSYHNYSSVSPESIIEEVMEKLSDYYQKNMGDWIDEHQFLISSHNNWLIDRLESHLEAKSVYHHRDTPKRYVYMMNNLNHMKIVAKKLRLKDLLDKDWFTKITEKVQEKLEPYQRSSWNELLDLLKLDSNVVAESMKAKLNLFNQQFEETCEEQSTRRIFDKQLWEQTIKSLENILLPAYGNFIQRICDVLGNHDDECIKYETNQIQDRLRQLLRDDLHWEINRKKLLVGMDL